MKAAYTKYILNFKNSIRTSRGVMTSKPSWMITLEREGRLFVGECGLLPSLSCDKLTDYEDRLQWLCSHIDEDEQELWERLRAYPSIQFGLEQIKSSLLQEVPMLFYPSAFTKGKDTLTINGLIWMNDIQMMRRSLVEKVAQGFHCVKFKIGSLDFEKEYELIAQVRTQYDRSQLEIRVDANGAFSVNEAPQLLQRLATLDIHSIEQPIESGQVQEMARLCEQSPIPIALDEELIGVTSLSDKQRLIRTIRPQYIILKPSLIGGYRGSEEWIRQAETLGVGWWATSALESNIGLSAIAQWTYTQYPKIPQGLGTGGLYTNNFLSPLRLLGDKLGYDKQFPWKVLL